MDPRAGGPRDGRSNSAYAATPTAETGGVVTCERTKTQRIIFRAARPGEVWLDKRLRIPVPAWLRKDRPVIVPPMWICSHIGDDPAPEPECGMHLCAGIATHECDGCDTPICEAHAINRGVQTIETDTGFASPGWSRVLTDDTYDLCPLCLFVERRK